MKKKSVLLLIILLSVFVRISAESQKDYWQGLSNEMKEFSLLNMQNGSLAQMLYMTTVIAQIGNNEDMDPQVINVLHTMNELFSDKFLEYEIEYWIEQMDRYYYKKVNSETTIIEAFHDLVIEEFE